MKRIQIGASVLLALLITLGFLRGQQPARAQDEQAKGNLFGNTQGADPDVKGMVMVSFIRDGAIVHQSETGLGGSVPLFNTPTGTYDIRFEADGMITVIKRGLVVSKGQGNNVTAVMRRGQGVKVIQYEPTAATRDELAGRLAKLEAAVEALRNK